LAILIGEKMEKNSANSMKNVKYGKKNLPKNQVKKI
jgi:hypothetical protein